MPWGIAMMANLLLWKIIRLCLPNPPNNGELLNSPNKCDPMSIVDKKKFHYPA